MPRSLTPLRSRLAACAAAAIGVALFAAAPGGLASAAPAQQVCDPASVGGGEACFYTGPGQTGSEYDLSVPITYLLPLSDDGDCTDLPSGFGVIGSVTNNSPDTLYVLPASCPDTRPRTLPVAIIPPNSTGPIVPLFGARGSTTANHSVRLCQAGRTFDPVRLICA